jgi:3-methyladenine DNA glycosylase AlkC
MFINIDHQSQIDLNNHERINNKHLITLQSSNKQSKKIDRELKNSQNIPKLLQIQFAQYLNNLLEYSSELTYFAINAFQTSSLRRVQINTLVGKIIKTVYG